MHIVSSAGDPLPSIARERLDGSGLFAARFDDRRSTRAGAVHLRRRRTLRTSALRTHGETVLHHASCDGDLDIVQELMDSGADMFARNYDGRTPFDQAKPCIREYLLARYKTAVFEREGDLSLHSILRGAIYSFSDVGLPPHLPLQVTLPLGTLTLEEMRTLVRSFDGNLIRSEDDNGELPLHTAWRLRAPVEIVTILVEQEGLALRNAGPPRNTSVSLEVFKGVYLGLIRRIAILTSPLCSPLCNYYTTSTTVQA